MPQRGSSWQADEYGDRYVAYLDLLGFKSLVERADNSPSERQRLREILTLVQDSLCENPSIGMRLTFFSDCIVFSANRTDQGLLEVFSSIECLTFNLLQHDVLVRGGLAGGGAHHDGGFLFGTAVNRAYMLESLCAKNPITLVSQEVLADAKAFGGRHMEWLLEDSPQRYFVDYLRQFAEYLPEPVWAGKVLLDDPGRRVIDFVCHRLNRDTGTILAKAEWLRGYWNRSVAVHGVFGSIERGVTERYNSYGPTEIVRRMVARQNPSK